MSSSEKKTILIEIWSDVSCPFCYIGKRNLEKALAKSPQADQVEIQWKSFQLDPTISTNQTETQNAYEYLAERKGMPLDQVMQMHENVVAMAKNAGLDFHFEKTKIVNSFRAHRLLQFAKSVGKGDALKEALFYANFTEGLNFSSDEVLFALGAKIGLKQEEISAALTDSTWAEKVHADIQESREIGVQGVPFFVFDRKYAISGAQGSDQFVAVLEKVSEEK